MMKPILTVILVLISVVTLHAANTKDELKGVKQEINAKKKLINKTKKVEAAVSTELREINRNLQQKESDLGRLDRDLKQVESNLVRTGNDISKITEVARRKKGEIDRRLVSIYKNGEPGGLRVVFSSGSFPQMAENARYMKSVVENDKRIFADYNQTIQQMNTLKGHLQRDASHKERIKVGIAQKKREIEIEKSNKAAYLNKVRKNRSSYEASLKELKANASRLQSMLNRLEAQSRKRQQHAHSKPQVKRDKTGKKVVTATPPSLPPAPDRGFASQKGRMSMPVRGEIIESFGKHKHPEFNSFTFSKGLSIAARNGADIRSIYEGTVIFADYFKGFGNMVIVDHGSGYFSIYAHASRILKRVGAEVAKNEVVASVGDLDSSKGSHLYFEIRHQGRPQDPAAWVR